MHEFFKKYAHHLDVDDAIKMVHDKVECAMEYHKEGKKMDAVKYLKEAHEMLADLVSVMP